jgi:hypothetical protein
VWRSSLMFTVRFGGKGRDLCAMGCHPRASATIFSVLMMK